MTTAASEISRRLCECRAGSRPRLADGVPLRMIRQSPAGDGHTLGQGDWEACLSVAYAGYPQFGAHQTHYPERRIRNVAC
jgi:hypothetical protein